MDLLKILNISKIFDGKKAVDNISFSLAAGECLGVVGKSGSGKSTVAKLVSRLLNVDSGEIYFDGNDIANVKGEKLTKVYENMQMIFQSPIDSFNPRQTLGFSISEALRNRKKKKSETESKVKELLNAVGLPAEFANRYPHEVSGGQCQRAAIARAIVLKPKLLISDEATSALDANIEGEIVSLVKNLCLKDHIACLFITHNLGLLPIIANRVIVMDNGKIVEEGATAELMNNPKTEATKKLLEAYKFFDTNGS